MRIMNWQHLLRNLADGSGGSSAGSEGDGGKPAGGGLAALAAKEGGGAGAGGDGGGTSGAGGTGGTGGDGGQQQQQQGAAPYIPEGLPDAFKGNTERDVIDKLYGRVRELAPPENADGYKLELTPEQKKSIGDIDKDPVFPLVRKVAFDAGLSNGQLQKLYAGLHKEMSDGGFLAEPVDPDVELGKLMPKSGTEVQKRAEAARRVNNVTAEVRGLVEGGVLNKPLGNKLMALAEDAEGVMVLEAIFGKLNGKGVNPGGEGGGNLGYSWDQYDRDLKDERYWSSSAKYDPTFRADVDKKMRGLGKRPGR